MKPVGDKERKAAIDELLQSGCSCVVCNGGGFHKYHRKGVADLYWLLTKCPAALEGAFVADKVVGKGAAALMALGGVSGVWTSVISRPALELFERAGMEVEYGEVVPNIINREGTGLCPVETLCTDATTPQECLPLISKFIEQKSLENHPIDNIK